MLLGSGRRGDAAAAVGKKARRLHVPLTLLLAARFAVPSGCTAVGSGPLLMERGENRQQSVVMMMVAGLGWSGTKESTPLLPRGVAPRCGPARPGPERPWARACGGWCVVLWLLLATSLELANSNLKSSSRPMITVTGNQLESGRDHKPQSTHDTACPCTPGQRPWPGACAVSIVPAGPCVGLCRLAWTSHQTGHLINPPTIICIIMTAPRPLSPPSLSYTNHSVLTHTHALPLPPSIPPTQAVPATQP